MQKIKNIKEFRVLTKNKQLDCCILLCNGMLRSSKNIYFYSEHNKYEMMHEIDGTVEWLTEKQLLNNTNIGKALKNGALWKY